MTSFSFSASAMKLNAGIGGYSPFSFTTQTDSDGGKSLLRVKPTLFLGGLFEAPLNHFFAPEFGMVLHGSGEDNYSKSTYYLLTDLVYPLTAEFVLRYGYGLFMTRISGDGEEVLLNNGSSYSTFYTAGEAVTSYNSTINLGLEFVVRSDATFRLQTFVFQPFSSIDREVSYMFSYAFFFDGGGSI